MPPTVTLIPGDGVCAELVAPVRHVLDAAGAEVAFDEQPAGRVSFDAVGTALPEQTLASIRANKVALKGKLLTPLAGGYQSPTVAMRKALDLYAGVRPVRSLPGLRGRREDVDLVVVRENTEGLYAALEHTVTTGVVASLKVVSEVGSRRIARFAFELARRQGRGRVTAVHKANIMKRTDGLFLRVCGDVAKAYADITFDSLIVDNASMQLLMRPSRYEVIVCGNMYGDILSDLAAGLVGGISCGFGASFGDEIAVFEAIHGDAPDLEGTGQANPLPLLRPAVEMLRHLGQHSAADRIDAALISVMRGGPRTADLGGTASTREMTRAIASACAA